MIQEASGHSAGVLEQKIMLVVKAVIVVALLDAAVALYVNAVTRGQDFSEALLGVLALVIGAVPIALPLVMQVTMAIGAKKMAEKKVSGNRVRCRPRWKLEARPSPAKNRPTDLPPPPPHRPPLRPSSPTSPPSKRSPP